jgi:predicted histidine transporter YuiF (NhaC family)
MKLDDLKNIRDEEGKFMPESNDEVLDGIKDKLYNFNTEVRRNFVIETSTAAISLVLVLIMIGFGDIFYQFVIEELFPEISPDREIHFNLAMYLSLILMAIYCIIVPIKLYTNQQNNDSLAWTLTSRVNSEINKLEKQDKLWSKIHIWSFSPAVVISALFFWGLQVSVTGLWLPSVYLGVYFIFVALFILGGFWLKKNKRKRSIAPLLQNLYSVREELLKEG